MSIVKLLILLFLILLKSMDLVNKNNLSCAVPRLFPPAPRYAVIRYAAFGRLISNISAPLLRFLYYFPSDNTVHSLGNEETRGSKDQQTSRNYSPD